MSFSLPTLAKNPSLEVDEPAINYKGRMPALDGLRGLAILLVLYCHGTVIERVGVFDRLMRAAAEISWIGVDLFFVLSGFLITGILVDAKGQDNYFRNFYMRRTLRIFPLYYAALLFFFVITPRIAPGIAQSWGVPPEEGGQIWYWLYLSNFYQAFHVQEHVMNVSWSLGIEEQFYLTWPLVVFCLGRKSLMWVTAGMFALAVGLRIGFFYAPGGTWLMAFNFTPARFDALATGAWIALFLRGPGSRWRMLTGARLLAPVALVAVFVLLGWVYFIAHYRSGIVTSPAYYMFAFSLFALAFGGLLVIALAAPPTTLLGRVLRSRILTMFGKYSYAIYLLHSPIMVLIAEYLWGPDKFVQAFGSRYLGQLIFYVLGFSLSLAAGWLSWHLYEKWFLELKRFFPMHKKPTTAVAWQGADIAHGQVAKPLQSPVQ